MFQVQQARADVGAAWDKTHSLCGMRQPANSVSRAFQSREVAGSRRGATKAERTFFLNTLQRWISRNTPSSPHSRALHSVNTASLLPVCSQHRPWSGLCSGSLHYEEAYWGFFWGGGLLLVLKKSPLKQRKPWPTFTARSPHRGDWTLWVGRMWQSKQKGLSNARRERGGVD